MPSLPRSAPPRPDPGLGLRNPALRAPILAISAGIGMHAFNDLAIAASIPIALADLKALNALPLAYACLFIGVVTGGILSAHLRGRFGARQTALAAGLIFLCGALLTSGAQGAWMFVAGRLAQGLSDGVIAALCYSLIADLFPAALVARVFAIEAVVWALAAALGPLTGGYLTEVFGWRAAMLSGTPLAALFLLSAPAALPAQAAPTNARRRLALLPVALCLAGVAALALPTALPGLRGAAFGILLGPALIALALRRDGRRGPRFFPLGAFRAGQAGRGMWLMLLMPVTQAVSSVFLALVLGRVWGLAPIWTGWIIVIMPLGWSLSAIIVGRIGLPQRRRMLRLAPALQTLGALLIAAGVLTGILALVIIGHAAAGLAFGSSWGPLNELVNSETEAAQKSHTASFMPTLQTAGFAIGAALFGWLSGLTGLIPALESGALTLPILALWGSAAALSLMSLWVARGLDPAR